MQLDVLRLHDPINKALAIDHRTRLIVKTHYQDNSSLCAALLGIRQSPTVPYFTATTRSLTHCPPGHFTVSTSSQPHLSRLLTFRLSTCSFCIHRAFQAALTYICAAVFSSRIMLSRSSSTSVAHIEHHRLRCHKHASARASSTTFATSRHKPRFG